MLRTLWNYLGAKPERGKQIIEFGYYLNQLCDFTACLCICIFHNIFRNINNFTGKSAGVYYKILLNLDYYNLIKKTERRGFHARNW